MALQLKMLGTPLSKDIFCQVWLKLAQRFWKKRYLNFVNVFLLFRNYLHLANGMSLHLNKLKSTIPKTFCAKFCWNSPSGYGVDENVKFLQTDERTGGKRTDDRQLEKLTWAFSSGEMKTTNTFLFTLKIEFILKRFVKSYIWKSSTLCKVYLDSHV